MFKIIKYIIFFFLVLGLAIWFLLISGIKIDSFSLGNFFVSKLYLKLDKKLILEIENLKFKADSKDSKKFSPKEFENYFLQIPKILDIFQKIDIERIHIKDNEFTLEINDREFYLDNKDINISTKLKFFGNVMTMEVYSIFLKKHGLVFMGNSKIDINKGILNFFGNYKYKDVVGELNIQSNKNILDFYINTNKSIKSLKFIKDFIRLDPVAEEWMYDNVKGDIKLNYLYGKVDLNKQEPIINSIEGNAIIKNAKIHFNKGVKSVNTSKLELNYKNDTLSFKLDNPIYNKSKLYGSKISISNLTSLKKGVVHVDLKSDSILNDDILEILNSFKVKLPLKQFSGQLDSKLKLDVPYLAARKMYVNGEFYLKDAKMKLNNFEFYANYANVTLKDDMVYINDSLIKHKNMIDSKLKLAINTRNYTALGEANLNRFKIKTDNTTLINIEKKKIPLNIDFKKDTRIDLKTLNTFIDIKKNSTDVNINKISSIYPYSKLLNDANIKDGSLNINIIDENKIYFNVNAINLNLPFEKNSKKITVLNAKGSYVNGQTIIENEDKDFNIIINKDNTTLLKLKDIDINLNDSSNKKQNKLPDVSLELNNSKLIIDENNKYDISKAKVRIKNSKISFNGKVNNLDLPISKNGKKITTFDLNGIYFKNKVNLFTNDGDINFKYDINKKIINAKINNYDVLYDTNEKEKKDDITYFIKGNTSNIIINGKYIAKATFYNLKFNEKETDIDLNYNKTHLVFRKDINKKIVLEAENMNDEFLNSLLGKNLVKGGSVNLKAEGKDYLISGTANLENTKIVDLAILNNLLILINTSPGIINPFLAIPSVVNMASSKGFNLAGYSIVKGKIDFIYNFDNKFLNMNKITTKGNGIDFDGYANIDFETSKIDSKLKLIFFKTYSKVVGAIPVINYILLGDQNRVDTEVSIYGTLDEPEYKTALVKEGIKAPVNLIKRIIQSPLKLIESIGNIGKEDKKEKKE